MTISLLLCSQLRAKAYKLLFSGALMQKKRVYVNEVIWSFNYEKNTVDKRKLRLKRI